MLRGICIYHGGTAVQIGTDKGTGTGKAADQMVLPAKLGKLDGELLLHPVQIGKAFLSSCFDHQHRLAVGTMLCLAEQVACHKGRIGKGISHHHHLARTCRHIDGTALTAHLLFGLGHILVARPENLVHCLDGFGSISKCCYGLCTPNFIDLCDGTELCCVQNGWMNFPLLVRRGGKHHRWAPCHLGRNSQHQNGGKQGSRTAGDVKPHPAERNHPARKCNPGSHVNLLTLGKLCLVKGADIFQGFGKCSLESGTDQLLSLRKLIFAYPQTLQCCPIELECKAQKCRIPFAFDRFENGTHPLSHIRSIGGVALQGCSKVLLLGNVKAC
ncbi:hypothetical protein SDC9_92605 [bioreactor metagenome]|uniref:Uncharacterized protein n=1 Tax=bioreactor metagenome TaxID=1076179 RepID=A0A645A500_9ZZZZ